MKHPAPEELVSWFYGEANSREQREIKAHVDGCATCRAQVDTWRDTSRVLNDLPAPAARKRFASAPWQWAAAAALLLGLGIALGRFALPGDNARLRAVRSAEMERQVAAVRVDMAQEFERRHAEALVQIAAAAESRIAASNQKLGEEFAALLEQARAEDRAVYLTALKELGARHDAEMATLKRGIETVVALADYGFEATEQRLAQLAASTQTTE
jgi:hypothetical protein